MTRKHIPSAEKLASALAIIAGIPYDHRKLMTADQVISLFHFDHDPIPFVHGGPDSHFNLTPRLIAPHRKKTAEVDVPQIAKTRRIADAERAFWNRILALTPRPKPPRRRIPSRPFQKRGKKS